MRTDDYVIHIIDDDAAVRRTLELLVRSAGYPAETYATASAYLGSDPKCTEGCVLLDICMPGMDGLRLLEVLAQSRPTMPVVMMTGHGDVGTAVKAMKLGAVEFLEKPFSDTSLFEAISASRERSATRHADGEAAAAASRLESLSRREREILARLAAGQQNKAIAYDLGISVRTAEVHRARMLRRLNVRTLAEAVRLHVLAGA